MINIPKYPAYKPSGVEWLGDIPEHWEISRLGLILNNISERDRTDLPLLSITREKGVILRDLDNEEENHNFIPDDLTNYKVLRKGQFGMNKMKAWQGSYGISEQDGIVSPAYFIFQLINDIEPTFFHVAIRSKLYVSFFGSASDGVRIGQWDLSKERMKQIPFLIPPLSEQTAIATFLDRKTELIDKAIGIKEKQIDLLKERRQILIYKAVTRGLNPDVKLKDSGVEWIGEIPEHWEVKRAKYLFDEIGERSKTGDEELLSVSHMTGVTPRSEKNVSMFQPEDYSGSKLCHKDDLIFNIMWAWMGALGVSDRTGIVSPSYAVYRQKKKTFNSFFIENLLRSINYVAHYNRVSTGLHSSRLRFYSTMFFEMAIGYPPLEEQNKIVIYIESASSKIATAISLKEKEIEKLKEYKESLINEAVTGIIKVN